MTLDSSKNLGGIGAILLVIAAVAFFAQPILTVTGIVGAILVLLALRGLADFYKERCIFNNGLYAFIALIVGVGATFAGLVYLLFYTSYLTDLVAQIYPGFNGDWSTLPSLTPNTNVDPSALIPFIGPILSILAIGWVFAIIVSFFTWRSIKTVAEKSNVSLFSTAGILLLIGSVLIIAFGFGLILMWIAVLLIAIAFFQIKPPIEQVVAPSSPPSQATL